MPPSDTHHRIVIIGGGTAGITVAAQLRRQGETDVALVEPSIDHWYQPLWTLVGAGEVDVRRTRRPEWTVVPEGVTWIRDRAVGFDPDNRVVHLDQRGALSYEALVVCPGLVVDFDAVPGVSDALGHDGVGSVYQPDQAPRVWEMLRSFEGGRAVFTMPAGPIKCGGAPQKIMYLAADHFRRSGVADRSDIIFASAVDAIFGIAEYRTILEGVVARYGIDTRFQHSLSRVDADRREATFTVTDGAEERTEIISYDFLHVVPPMRAPDFVRDSPLAVPDDPRGWVAVDEGSLVHVRYPDVFALGDVSSTPNGKTGAAVRKQAPVVVANLLAQLAGRTPTATYDGYTSCPLLTGYGRMLLAEFDYSGRPHPTIPVINTFAERRDMWYLKKYGLPFLYWNGMLRGRA